jgi:hypothetical protein
MTVLQAPPAVQDGVQQDVHPLIENLFSLAQVRHNTASLRLF